jgi:integrase
MATFQKRTSGNKTKYRVMIRIKGHPPESATFDRLTDAREWAGKIERDIREDRHFGVSRWHTLSELIARYRTCKEGRLKSWRETDRHLGIWLRLLGDCLLSEITPGRIAEGRDKLLAEITVRGKPRHPGTVTRIMAALSACLSYGVKELQWLERNPCERTSKPGHCAARVRYLTDAERTALLNACKASSNPDLYLAVVLSLTTGARKSEIMGLRWSQIDLEHRTITLRQGETKNKEARILPLVGEAFALVEARAKARRKRTQGKIVRLRMTHRGHDALVFPPTERARKSVMLDLRTPWETALEVAGLGEYLGRGKARRFVPSFRWHDLRHTAASYLAMGGVSPLEISKILGHRTMAMVSRYSHLAPGRVVELGDALAKRLGLA